MPALLLCRNGITAAHAQTRRPNVVGGSPIPPNGGIGWKPGLPTGAHSRSLPLNPAAVASFRADGVYPGVPCGPFFPTG